MRNVQHKHAPVAAPAPEDRGEVAAGGPVAMLHQSIQHRIGAADLSATLIPFPQASAVERTIQAVSRAAGPVVLIAAYAFVASAYLG